MHERTPSERALFRAVPYLGLGAAAALPLLLVPKTSHYLTASTAHLAAVVLFGLVLAFHLSELTEEPGWFEGYLVTTWVKRLLAAVLAIVLTTGVVALVTLATAAALRFQPSLQYLQLLSALDIAWAGAAIVIGARRWGGTRAAVGGGLTLAVVCVWSIWRYLRNVGFAGDGGWLVDGSALMEYVLPYDMAAALIAVVVLVVGTRRSQPIAQPSAQS